MGPAPKVKSVITITVVHLTNYQTSIHGTVSTPEGKNNEYSKACDGVCGSLVKQVRDFLLEIDTSNQENPDNSNQ